MSRVWSGRTSGHGASGLVDLRVWTTEEGYALTRRLPTGELAVLASTSDSPDAAGAPVGARCDHVGGAGLAGVVPPGFGVLVDGGTPDGRLVSAEIVDGLRVAEPPDGSEPDLRCDPVPAHLAAVARDAITAARSAGAKRGVAVWATGGGREGLWLSLHGAPEPAAAAAMQAVSRHAPREAVRVLDLRALDTRARTALHAGVGREPTAGRPEQRPFSATHNVLIATLAVIGAVLVVLGRARPGPTGTALQAAGWALEGLLVLGVVVAASGRGFSVPGLPSRGSGAAFRPLPFLCFVAVSAALLWQATRSLG